ncbi:hypothetical protein [Gryllotalpicola koreensis]|uniref:Uncharacterized protein n=1 Tax=Gryllotalpicola koreensis TaxID=993086 RepID=A0ABP8A364_9MICO
MTVASGPVSVGTVEVICPVCEQIVPVPVTADIVGQFDQELRLECTPDMADLWAHMWAHEEAPSEC